jgi:hypothetical protein
VEGAETEDVLSEEEIARFRADPISFARKVLGIKFEAHQEQFARAVMQEQLAQAVVVGRCADCYCELHQGEPFSTYREMELVLGRIGNPDTRIRGYVKGPTTLVCMECDLKRQQSRHR